MPRGYRQIYISTANVTDGKKPPSTARGLFGWVLMIGVAILIFLYLQNSKPPTAKVPNPTPVVPSDPAAVLMACGLTVGGLAFFAWRFNAVRRSNNADVTEWNWDDQGISSHFKDARETIVWTWVSNVETLRHGVRLTLTSDVSFIVPDAAFIDAAERAAFIETAQRYHVPIAKGSNDVDRGRGFEVRTD